MVRGVVVALALSAVSADEVPPTYQSVQDLALSTPEDVATWIAESPLAAIAPEIDEPAGKSGGSYLPTVVAHGMGDSCFNRGMKSITKAIGTQTGEYSVCIGTGNNRISDTINGFLKNMDSSVDFFADKIKQDPKLANGFNCVGFSQGNSLCRGYIQKYQNPPVNAFLSVHGTVMGVSAFPSCFKQGKPLGIICKALAEIMGDLAYSELAQAINFQSDYFRHNVGPKAYRYLKHSQLAAWNNENPEKVNPDFKTNFLKTNKYVMVKALEDLLLTN